MSLGEKLRQARETRGLSIREVAEATHMMVQLVEEIEREDFHRIAAVIYGKGFIRLFAEHVGLDPEPLVQEYIEKHVSPGRPENNRFVAHGDTGVSRPVPDEDAGQDARKEAPQSTGMPGERTDGPPAAPPRGEEADAPALSEGSEGTVAEEQEENEPDLFSLAEWRRRSPAGIPPKRSPPEREIRPPAWERSLKPLVEGAGKLRKRFGRIVRRGKTRGMAGLADRLNPRDPLVRRVVATAVSVVVILLLFLAAGKAWLRRREASPPPPALTLVQERILSPPQPYID